MAFHSSNKVMIYFKQESIKQLTIFEITRLHINFAIMSINALYFSANYIVFIEIASHLKLIFFWSSSLQTSRQIYICKIQNCMLIRINVNRPSLIIYWDYPSYNYVPDIWLKTCFQRAHLNNFVYSVHYSG